jgi:hypothetical protein
MKLFLKRLIYINGIKKLICVSKQQPHSINSKSHGVNQLPQGSLIQVRPLLSSPLNNATLHETTVTLCAKPHPNPLWDYHFQLANQQDFPALVDERDELSSPKLVIDNLTPGRYFWRMRGVKPGRLPSAWSETWSFTIAHPDDETN